MGVCSGIDVLYIEAFKTITQTIKQKMVGARVENKLEKLMRGAHKILKEWIETPRSNKQVKLVKVPVITKRY